MSAKAPESNSFPYQDILDRGCPNHLWNDPFRLKHPSMDPGRRAKLFAPFDALKGFSEAISAKEALCLGQKVPGSEWLEDPDPRPALPPDIFDLPADEYEQIKEESG